MPHLSPDQIAALVDGRIDSPLLEVVVAHVERCSVCQKRLRSQSGRRESGNSGEHVPPIAASDLAFLDRLKALGRPGLLGEMPESQDEPRSSQGGLSTTRTNDSSPRPAEPACPGAAPLPSIRGFKILREIGRGGMGIVYEAIDVALGRQVALKLLPPQWVSHPTAVGRFRRESRLAGRLHHTNIVPVFGVGED
jgi:serine/threonine protein kinase